jgi:hypothetical protein
MSIPAENVNDKTEIHGGFMPDGTAIDNLGVGTVAVSDWAPASPGHLNFTGEALQVSVNEGGAVVPKTLATTDDVANVQYHLNALGSGVYNLVDLKLAGGATLETAFDLATLEQKDAGDTYELASGGWFKLGDKAVEAKVGDTLTFTKNGGFLKYDNTDSEVSGTAGFVSVTGNPQTGFVVDLDPAFKQRMQAVEGGLASEAEAREDAVNALNFALTQALATAINNLRAGMNGLKVPYESAAALAEHAVNHGLGVRHVEVSVVARKSPGDAWATVIPERIAEVLDAEGNVIGHVIKFGGARYCKAVFTAVKPI